MLATRRKEDIYILYETRAHISSKFIVSKCRPCPPQVLYVMDVSHSHVVYFRTANDPMKIISTDKMFQLETNSISFPLTSFQTLLFTKPNSHLNIIEFHCNLKFIVL
jgi:hypothetical protein